MIIKTPPCYDVSHWRPVADFAQVSPRPLLAITKATEGLTFVDDTFVKHFTDMQQDGIHRGAYHFLRKSSDSAKQGQHFCNTIRPYITDKDLLILDVEEGGETAAQLKVWFDFVRSQFPRNRVMIYSRKNILDQIPMTQAQKDYFKDIPTWVAGYPNNPDVFPAPPEYYIPDQSKWGVVWLWQYTDRGEVAGVGRCDCNWMSPVLVALLGDTIPPDNGGTMIPGKAKEILGKSPAVRSAPSISATQVGTIQPFAEIEFLKIVDDREHPGEASYKWFEMGVGRYTAYKYPRTSGLPDRFVILSLPQEPDPEPPTLPDLNVTIEATGYPLTKVTIKPL